MPRFRVTVRTDSPALAATSLAAAGLEVLPPWAGSAPARYEEHDVAVLVEAKDALGADERVRTIVGVDERVEVATHGP